MLNKNIRLPMEHEHVVEMELDDGVVHVTLLLEGKVESSMYPTNNEVTELCIALKELQEFAGRGN